MIFYTNQVIFFGKTYAICVGKLAFQPLPLLENGFGIYGRKLIHIDHIILIDIGKQLSSSEICIYFDRYRNNEQ